MPQRLPADAPANLSDAPDAIAREVHAVAQIESVPTLLAVLCRMTGMRFAAVARVTEKTWTACAVKDEIHFGLQPGSQLDVETTLCVESRRTLEPIVIEHASQDARYRNHPTPTFYKIESYISVPIILKDGGYFGNLCAIDLVPAKIGDPKILDMFKSFASIIALQLETELKHETIQSALRDAQATNELREQFIAILGHDLRNPLQAVASAGEFLELKSTEPALKNIAARIRVNVKRMSSLIDDVLDFARGRLGGGIGLNVDAIDDIDAGLAAVVKEFQDGQPHRQILANISVCRPVRCDLGRVQQVASNLIGNALTHGAPSSPVKVDVRTDSHDLVLEVWNAGDPIPADSIDKIFEPFWRHSSVDSRQGLGLGLHICSQIVRAHGGSISVKSTKEEGTSFIARLPLEASLQ